MARRFCRRIRYRPTDDQGTVIPLVLLSFLIGCLLLCAVIAESAAFLAHRELVGFCDGAAIAAANAYDRPTVTAAPPDVLPLDELGARQRADRYRRQIAAGGATPPTMDVSTDGRTVLVVCRRVSRLPFGALLGHPDGLQRTVVSRARAPLA